MVLSLTKFWEKLVTHHYTREKTLQTSTTWKLFQLIFRMCKSVCIDCPIIKIILKFNKDHEVGTQSQWNKIDQVCVKERNQHFYVNVICIISIEILPRRQFCRIDHKNSDQKFH